LVNPLEMCLVETTGWAHPGRVIQDYFPGLYSGNYEKHSISTLYTKEIVIKSHFSVSYF
jgi:G3E family GTPase